MKELEVISDFVQEVCGFKVTEWTDVAKCYRLGICSDEWAALYVQPNGVVSLVPTPVALTTVPFDNDIDFELSDPEFFDKIKDTLWLGHRRQAKLQ